MKSRIKSYETRLEKNTMFPFYIYKIEGRQNTTGIYAHWHEELEILYVHCSGIVEIEGTPLHFNENDIIFINKEQLHLVNVLSDGVIYAIVFDYSLLDFNNSDFCQIHIIENLKNKKILFPSVITNASNEYEMIKNYLFEMVNHYHGNIPGKELKIKCNLYEILFLLYSANKLSKRTEMNIHDVNQLSYVKATILHMENDYHLPLTIDELAKKVSISKFHLIKIFKQITGVTPIIYLRDLRIEKSIKYLNEGYSVTQAAYMCGFNNLSYFIRTFRKRFKASPKEFQKTTM